MAPRTIVVVGGIIADLFIEIPHMPVPGEVVLGSSLRRYPGGKGANMAVAIRRANDFHSARSLSESRPDDATRNGDVQVYLNGAVGDDGNGAFLLTEVAQSGVDVSHVQVLEGVETATAIMLLGRSVSDSRPGIIAFRTANKLWSFQQEGDGVFSMAGGIRPDLVISDLAISLSEAVQVLANARQHDIETILNPGPAVYLEASVLQNVTHLVLNEEEAAVLSRQSSDGPHVTHDWAETADYFLQQGVANVVLTLGDKGAYFATSRGEKGVVEALPNITAVDTTGAGFDMSIG